MDYAVGPPKVGFAYKSRMSCEVCFWPILLQKSVEAGDEP